MNDAAEGEHPRSAGGSCLHPATEGQVQGFREENSPPAATEDGCRISGAFSYTSSVVPLDDASRDAALSKQWEQLAQTSNNLYAFYQSPAWWDYSLHGTLRDYILRLHESEMPVLVRFDAADGTLAGVVGVNKSRCPLVFQFRSRTLMRVHVRAMKILGGQPLLRDEEDLYVELVRSLLAAFPDYDCIYMQFIPIGSFCWEVLCKSQKLQEHAEVYFPGEAVPHARITLPQSFKEYLHKFKSKTRYNLVRQVRQLREHGGGQLEVVRIEHAQDVQAFLDEATAISTRSWQFETLGLEMNNSSEEYRRFTQFAENRALRCYLLRCGGSPCAFVRGFQYGDVFYYSRIGFDEGFAALSPGTVLLYLLVEDLFSHRPPRYVNFQEGDWDYKRLFATDYLKKMDVLLLRRGARLRSRLAVGMHRTYRSSLQLVKRLIRWKGPSDGDRV